MFDVLAAMSQTTVQDYGPAAAILIALGGWKGIAQAILWLQGRTGKEFRTNEEGKHVSEEMCKFRHEQFDKRQDERHQTLVAGINEVKESIRSLHGRMNGIGHDHETHRK